MTNEEMAVAIQQGDSDLISPLWDQIQRFLYMLAHRYYSAHEEQAKRCGATPEDFEQIAFLAMLDMIKAYAPQKEFRFIAYAEFAYRKHASELLQIRTSKREPLNNCSSLDITVDDNSDTTYGDLIIDAAAEKEFDNVIDSVWRLELRQAEENALNMINQERALLLRKEFFDGESIASIAESLNITENRARHLRKSGLRDLRKNKPALLLNPFCDTVYRSLGLRKIGVTAFRNGGSSTERAVETLEDWVNRKRFEIT